MNYGFASDVKGITIAPRVDAPSIKAESVGVDAIQLTEIDGCEYRIAGEEWQDYPVFIGLEPNTSYTFEARHKCKVNKSGNNSSFDLASEISTVQAATLDGIMAPVQMNYHGMMTNDLYYGIFAMMNDLSYGLHEGENVIDVNKFVMDYGFIAASKEDEFVTINVDRIDGKLVPEQDIIFNVEMIEFSDDGSVVPVNAEDYSFTVLYWDSEKQELVAKQSSNFVVPGVIVEEELNIPDGYKLQDDFFPENVDVPYLGYCDGVWRVYYAEISLDVLATEPSTDPTNAPTDTLTTQQTSSADVSLNANGEPKEQKPAGESQGKGDNVHTGENRELVSVMICAFAVSAAFMVGLGLRRRKETDD